MTGIVAAAVSHVGKIRANNQDSGYRGRNLFVVADGMGGHAGGDIASAVAVNRVLQVDHDFGSIAEARVTLEASLSAANTLLSETVLEHPDLSGMGTTVSALLRVGDQLALAHIGDSRIYRLHNDTFEQLTVDHTFVQRLVETGRITPEEALVHPRRSVLMRVLGDVDAAPEIDTAVLDLVVGDRWLICSDGLSSYVDEEEIADILRDHLPPEEVAQQLLDKSLDAGAPDNVTIIVFDVTDGDIEPTPPLLVGSVVEPLNFELANRKSNLKLTATLRHPIIAVTNEDSHFEPGGDDYLDELIAQDKRRARWRRLRWLAAILVLLALAVGGSVLAYQWTQTRYYVGVVDGNVAIFQGVQQDLGPIKLSSLYEMTDIEVNDLPAFGRQRVLDTISAGSLEEAREIVKRIDDTGIAGGGNG